MTHINRRSAMKGLGARFAAAAAFGVTLSTAAAPAAAQTQSAGDLDAAVDETLQILFQSQPGARQLYSQAAGALIIPEVVQGGIVVGAAHGAGALRVDGRTASYWQYNAGSIGFQFGLQRTRQVLLFMTRAALADFRAGSGWEIGADAEVTVIESGAGFSTGTMSGAAPVVAIVFGRTGLLGGASIQGGRYSRFIP